MKLNPGKSFLLLEKVFNKNFRKNIFYFGEKMKKLNFSSHIFDIFDIEKYRAVQKNDFFNGKKAWLFKDYMQVYVKFKNNSSSWR